MEKDAKDTKSSTVKKNKLVKKKKSKASKNKGNTKVKEAGDKLVHTKRSSSANDYLLWNRVQQSTQANISGKKTPPFVAGSTFSKTHNINLKIQEIKKARIAARQGLKNPLSTTARVRTLRKGKESTTESVSTNAAKIKEMFVDLHNEFSDLMKSHANLKLSTNGEDTDKLQQIEKHLQRKELQINVVVQLYDENIKLKEELIRLRKKEKAGGRLNKPGEEEIQNTKPPAS